MGTLWGGGGGSAVVLWRQWFSLIAALWNNASNVASSLRAGEVMLARTGNCGIGLACRQLETVCRELLKVVSSFYMWALLHHTWAQYSMAEKMPE